MEVKSYSKDGKNKSRRNSWQILDQHVIVSQSEDSKTLIEATSAAEYVKPEVKKHSEDMKIQMKK